MTPNERSTTPLPRDCCPICGYQFDDVRKVQVCPYCYEESEADKLITLDDDYAWVI